MLKISGDVPHNCCAFPLFKNHRLVYILFEQHFWASIETPRTISLMLIIQGLRKRGYNKKPQAPGPDPQRMHSRRQRWVVSITGFDILQESLSKNRLYRRTGATLEVFSRSESGNQETWKERTRIVVKRMGSNSVWHAFTRRRCWVHVIWSSGASHLANISGHCIVRRPTFAVAIVWNSELPSEEISLSNSKLWFGQWWYHAKS